MANTKGLQAVAAMTAMLFLSACGFSPMYAKTESATGTRNSLIALDSLAAPGEASPFLKDAFRKRFASSSDSRFRLEALAEEQARPLTVQIDATARRYNYALSVRYRIRDTRDQKVYGGTVRTTTSYNIVPSAYSTLVAENAARERAAILVAEQIEQDIFKKIARAERRAQDAATARIERSEALPDVTEDDGDPFLGVFTIEEEALVIEYDPLTDGVVDRDGFRLKERGQSTDDPFSIKTEE